MGVTLLKVKPGNRRQPRKGREGRFGQVNTCAHYKLQDLQEAVGEEKGSPKEGEGAQGTRICPFWVE